MQFFSQIFSGKKILVPEDELVWKREQAPIVKSYIKPKTNIETRQNQQNDTHPNTERQMYQSDFSKERDNENNKNKNNISSLYRNRTDRVKHYQSISNRNISQGKTDPYFFPEYDDLSHSQQIAPKSAIEITSAKPESVKNTIELPKAQIQTQVQAQTQIQQQFQQNDNFQEIERRVTRRIMNDEFDQKPMSLKRTNIFAETSTPLQNSIVRQRINQNTITEKCIEARPETKFRKLQIFEKLNLEKHQKTTSEQVLVKNDFQDIEHLIEQNRKLDEELIQLESVYSQMTKDPRNLTIQENTYRMLIENVKEEETKNMFLMNERKLIDEEVAEKTFALSQFNFYQNTRNVSTFEPDFFEKEKIISDIEKLKSKISGQKFQLENYKSASASNYFRMKEMSEKELESELINTQLDIQNFDNLLLQELEFYDKKYR